LVTLPRGGGEGYDPMAMALETAFRSEELFTQEEFWDWLQERPSSDINHYELIGGRIVMTPPAGYPHGGVGSRLARRLGNFVEPRDLGLVFDASTGYDLPSGDTLEPDVSFVSRGRLEAGPPPVRGRFLRVVPDLVVEILSRSTRTRDLVEKRAIYAQNGVEEYWIVDSGRCEIALLVRSGATFTAEPPIRSGALPSRVLSGIEFDVAELFAGY
jgi:Uma2 family endonuclease